MNLSSCFKVWALMGASALLVLGAMAANQSREHLLLDDRWTFHLADDWPHCVNLCKAARSTGPTTSQFVDNA